MAGDIQEAVRPTSWSLLNRLDKSDVGMRDAMGVIRVKRSELKRCFLYGPYLRLPTGHYRLTFNCAVARTRIASQPIVAVEVIAQNRIIRAWRDFTTSEIQNGHGSLDFEVPPELGLHSGNDAPFEFKFFHLGNADLAIKAVDLWEMQRHELVEITQTNEWRLFGRFRKRWAAKLCSIAERSGAKVSWWMPQGCFLESGMPHLLLGRGCYRLTFRCAIGNTRSDSQLVLGLEITTPGGLYRLWRDCTAGELRTGQGIIDFELPAEVGVESGANEPLKLKFFHFGNTDVTLYNATLRKLVHYDLERSLKSQWRLLTRFRSRSNALAVDALPPLALKNRFPKSLDLQLRAGSYRLSFVCHAKARNEKSKAALAVEVAVRKRWQNGWLLRRQSGTQVSDPGKSFYLRRIFTLTDLEGGTGSLEFTLPPELATNVDSEIRTSIRLLSLDEIDLAFSAIDLCTLRDFSTDTEYKDVIENDTITTAGWLRGSRKASVLVVGNCQAEMVRDAFWYEPLSNRFRAKFHYVRLANNLHEHAKKDLQKCDILLVQDIQDWKDYPLHSFIPSRVEIIKFPCLRFASLWPFDAFNGLPDRKAEAQEAPNLNFLYFDGLLGRLRKEVPDKNKRFEVYRSLALDRVPDCLRLHRLEVDRLTKMDNQFNCMIGQFILESFRDQQIFYTTNHPNVDLFILLMQQIMKTLRISQVFPRVKSLDELKRKQVPPHPLVAKALGVRWAHEKTKYCFRSEWITWETYVRRYIDFYG